MFVRQCFFFLLQCTKKPFIPSEKTTAERVYRVQFIFILLKALHWRYSIFPVSIIFWGPKKHRYFPSFSPHQYQMYQKHRYKNELWVLHMIYIYELHEFQGSIWLRSFCKQAFSTEESFTSCTNNKQWTWVWVCLWCTVTGNSFFQQLHLIKKKGWINQAFVLW